MIQVSITIQAYHVHENICDHPHAELVVLPGFLDHRQELLPRGSPLLRLVLYIR
jgi:hypothetical protein